MKYGFLRSLTKHHWHNYQIWHHKGLRLNSASQNCPFTPFIDWSVLSPHTHIKKFDGSMHSAFLEQQQQQAIKSSNHNHRITEW